MDSNSVTIRMTGRRLDMLRGLHSAHALYRCDGKWYHHLARFPGTLHDAAGYVTFNSGTEYMRSASLQMGLELHVPRGIAALPGYTLAGRFGNSAA